MHTTPITTKIAAQILASLLALILYSCGGGSGDSESTDNFVNNTVEEATSNPEVAAATDLSDTAQSTLKPSDSSSATDSALPTESAINSTGSTNTQASQSAPVSVQINGPVCDANTLDQLTNCFSNSNNYSGVTLSADISCSGGNCCSGGNPFIDLNNVNGLTIDGQGHSIFRDDNQTQCSAIRIRDSKNIQLYNLVLDEDGRDPGCIAGQNCPRTVNIVNSSDVRLEGVHVLNSKAYSVYTHQVNGFHFVNSSIINAGIVGLYIGHKEEYSSNVVIENSVFTDIQTNAIALLGVAGNNRNIVRNNVILRNHWKGHWDVPARFGSGKTGGGQLYIQQANNVLVTENEIHDGFCNNCFVGSNAAASVDHVRVRAISGIEIGPSLSNVRVASNRISNNAARGISFNVNKSYGTDIQIQNNTIFNNAISIQPTLKNSGAAVNSNSERDIVIFESFESQGALGRDIHTTQHCTTDSSVNIACGTALDRDGNCAAELQLGTASCDSPHVAVTSNWYQINNNENVSLSGWYRHGHGEWCIEFSDQSFSPTGKVCEPFNSIGFTAQGFFGSPVLDTTPPKGSQHARFIVSNQSEQTSIVDDIKMTGVHR